MSESSVDLKSMAGNNFRGGYNCAEAILRAFNDGMQLNVPNDALKMASGFGGGIGHAGCVCGALTASIMVLGLLKGRSDAAQDRTPMYASAEEFHHLFEEKFGATCCRVLNPHPFDTKEHLRNCLKITGSTADLLSNYIRK